VIDGAAGGTVQPKKPSIGRIPLDGTTDCYPQMVVLFLLRGRIGLHEFRDDSSAY
jgi:hypothetical protein